MVNKRMVVPVVNPQYNKSLIYTRLGYKKTKTVLSEEEKEKTDLVIEEAESYCSLKAGYIRIGIRSTDDSIIINNHVIKSEKLKDFLLGCNEAVIMFATAGAQIMKQISNVFKKNASKAIILDAAASEIADYGLDYIMEYINRQLLRENKTLTKMRFSAGYGDLDISYQKFFYDILSLSDFNIELTEKYMLVPEKTVTAIAGIY